MDLGKKNILTCQFYNMDFSSTFNKNRHIRRKHSDQYSGSTLEQSKRTKHIICPICTNETCFPFHKDLIKHLTSFHNITIKESTVCFRNFEEFTTWRPQENREVDYACRTRKTFPDGKEQKIYDCNRSDSKEFVSSAKKRNVKAGGSIRIRGTCPSRIVVNISANESVTTNFVETHVGHNDELRTKRLSKAEQSTIVGQLTAGVSNNRIIQDSRIIRNDTLQRINLITRGDLAYLIRKFNIDKRRDADDMIATVLKIAEWNRQGKNHAFLFKKTGENYPGLNDEDFAIGYTNAIMERKLRAFCRIICIDGTHGTNKQNLDLTIILIKDENNIGFPVAFFLSNRLDQTIQQIFFNALQVRLGEAVQAEYIMSDDDPKYYNAWCQVMSTADHKPRRLLCTWHVVKNWNIQGRSKIKKPEVRQNMKKEMRKILKETDPANFMELKENYLSHLQEEGENDFLNYLQRYYFQNEDRIRMWAHCHRINAGINTNMAIESLNKVLKYNKMNGQHNLRVEKLLDLLEELVDEKMWKRIVNTERPNANNYQHKITLEAHKKAEQMIGKVELSISANFKVQSCSVSGKYYFVSYNEICDEECRTGYCNKCKICLHKYCCQCPENAIKTVICKHIHAVALFEQRSESVLGPLSSEESNVLYIDEPSISQICYQNDVSHFIQETRPHTESITFDDQREIMLQEVNRYARSLDEQSFNKYMIHIRKFKSDTERQNAEENSKKRKIEKQTYYPSKK